MSARTFPNMSQGAPARDVQEALQGRVFRWLSAIINARSGCHSVSLQTRVPWASYGAPAVMARVEAVWRERKPVVEGV